MPDCEIECRRGMFLAVALRSPINLSDENKLEVLQRLDQFRVWHSLDEKRYCLVCGKIIIGQEIQVSGGINDIGPFRVNCPTEHCNSLPTDWVWPTDEVLIKISKLGGRGRGNIKVESVSDGGRDVHPYRTESVEKVFQQSSRLPQMGLTDKIEQNRFIAYLLIWLLAVPPILLLIFLLRGCT
jgi:hypothetical protein